MILDYLVGDPIILKTIIPACIKPQGYINVSIVFLKFPETCSFGKLAIDLMMLLIILTLLFPSCRFLRCLSVGQSLIFLLGFAFYCSSLFGELSCWVIQYSLPLMVAV